MMMPVELHNITGQKSVQTSVLEFYGLREQPFGPSPNPRFYYPGATHREVLATLIAGIENEFGFAAVIAEPGTGKTMLLFDLVLRYRDIAHTAFVFNTQCTSQELLRHIISELQIPDAENESDPVKLHQLFTLFVSKNAYSKPVLIIIDEAQNLGDSALEAVRLLSDFESPDKKLLHIILAGQPALADALQRATLSQLLQRINTISRIARYSEKEIHEYIQHRVKVAGGGPRPLFTPDALARIRDHSDGVPRAINRLCLNALQIGYVLRERVISGNVIDEVISDLALNAEPDFGRRNDVFQPQSLESSALPRAGTSPRATPIRQNSRGQQSSIRQAPSQPQTSKPLMRFRERGPQSQRLEQARLKDRIGSVWQQSSKKPIYAAIVVPVAILAIIITTLNYRGGEVRATPLPTSGSSSAIRHPDNLAQPTVANDSVPDTAKETRSSATREITDTSRAEHRVTETRRNAKHRTSATPEDTTTIEATSATNETAPLSISNVAPEKNNKEDLTARVSAPAIPVGGDPGAVRHVIEANASSTPTLAAMPRSKLVSGEPIDVVQPVYPSEAKLGHIHGDVILNVNVSKEGTVDRVRVVRGHPILARAAVDAVRQWRYRPYYLNGAPIPMELNVTVTFRP